MRLQAVGDQPLKRGEDPFKLLMVINMASGKGCVYVYAVKEWPAHRAAKRRLLFYPGTHARMHMHMHAHAHAHARTRATRVGLQHIFLIQ